VLLGQRVALLGHRVDLTAAGEAEGAVNTGTVTNPVPPNAPRTMTTGLFGEAAINLTAAGVFPAGTCAAFGSAFLKSRSSSSFSAESKTSSHRSGEHQQLRHDPTSSRSTPTHAVSTRTSATRRPSPARSWLHR
jgi:hypothetical protein